jgi:succinate dehydrogenase flavin-adding protein (antitoxin of CptAB toxin-antitoxin module)
VEGIGMSKVKEERVTDLSIIMEMIDSKPYYSVQYRNVGENGYNIGYSSYNLKIVLEFIDEYFEIVESDTQTNADRIRNMSDEELADWLHNMCDFEKDEEPYKSIYNLDTEKKEEIHDSYGDLLNWLQSEAE